MKLLPLILCILSTSVFGAPEQRTLLARFEISAPAGIYPVGGIPPPTILVFHRVTTDDFERVTVETTRNGKTISKLLEQPGGLRVLDAFDQSKLPEGDLNRHFQDLDVQGRKARRGMVLGGRGGGSTSVKTQLFVAGRLTEFEVRDPDMFFAGHLDDPVAVEANRLILAIASALGEMQITQGK